MKPDDPKEVEEQVANPYFTIILADYLFEPHELERAKEDWVAKNAQLMSEIGPREWLKQLLDILAAKSSGKPKNPLINPYPVVTFSQKLKRNDDPRFPRKVWVGANVNAISEISPTNWLWRLLKVLEKGAPEA
jgi:hypothetical protein